MKYHLIFFIGLIIIVSNLVNARCIVGNSKNDNPIKEAKEIDITYRFADSNEATDLILSNREFYEKLNQNNINYRLRKLNGTVEELMQFAIKQVLNYTVEEKKGIENIMNYLKKISKERGYNLPSAKNIVFVKTTMLEEFEAFGYTHGTQIYLGEDFLKWVTKAVKSSRSLIYHELFHCLTRNNPSFRKEMYKLIGYNLADKDFEFPKEITDHIINNPDVEHRNAYATFEINGKKRDCVPIFGYTKPFEKPEDKFYNNLYGLMPIDDPSIIYTEKDVTDFLGLYEEYSYIMEPEEHLAEKFGHFLSNDEDLVEEDEVYRKMDALLKSYKS